ncbi:hypothetical protein SOVF_125240 [Spinacia oleracea]|uniref:Uncharacterized protein n=1 Tax=Spinacia oleracea TaxID=3562 RepID=O24366_SPIOL|nr:uncharacterized protein LOC110793219 [Spinacia oleracea]KNA12493.1 hypothetical protein SOVF_125240 [Spinacia oleracea]CAA74590.1 hypothetical protein [Spinacia oleracea]
MATVLGTLVLPVDLTLPAKIVSDHRKKLRLLPYDVVLSLGLPRRDKEFQLWGENLSLGRLSFSRKSNAVEYSSGDENGNGNGEEEGGGDDEPVFDWETEMRKRVKEIEEMRELEKKAEELQGRIDDEGSDGSGVDETEEEKKMRVRKELEKVAKEQAERRATAQLMFELGQKAYGRGMYKRSIEFFEAALTIIPRPTLFGGEIQIWLAMAYEANSRHADCIALYKKLEKGHPSVSIRRQAAELRYILEAPKIKITQEEMVTIPLIGNSYDSYASSWTDKSKDSEQVIGSSTTNAFPSSRDYAGDLLKWKPPVGLENNRIFWAAVTLSFGLVGAALFLQR